VTDYGAIGDGTTNNAWAIQRAIDACVAGGGGRVVIPAGGVFMSGKIFLRSKVELHLEANATLLASPYHEDIRSVSGKRQLRPGFVCADSAQDISITGSGTLDGNGRSYIDKVLPEIYVMKKGRPRTLVFLGCSHINITGITVRDGAEWTLWFCGCENLLIEAIHLYNDLRTPNSDGMDIDRCRHVQIKDCHIEAGDDTIVLKTTRGSEEYGNCENILVSGCTLKSTSSALVIGCEVAAPIRHVVFDSCTIVASHRGLAINHSFESDIEDVLFSNVTIETRLFDDRWWGNGEPIYVKALPWTNKDKVGQIRNIRFQNIKARAENGILVWGESPDRIVDIHFDNIQLTLAKWTKFPADRLDLRPCQGQDNGYANAVIPHSTHGMILHNAQKVTVNKFDLVIGATFTAAAQMPIEQENVVDLQLTDFTHEPAPG
jgi:polygalacturonase